MLKKTVLFLSAFLPVFSFAAPTDFREAVRFFLDYTAILVPLIVALSLLVFLFGFVKFIFRVGGDEKEIQNGKHLMIYGFLGLVVMFCIWGILAIITGEFGAIFGIPQLPINS